MARRSTSNARSTAFWIVIALALIAGHLLPWAQHKTAALTQSAHDLAASARFTPGAGVFRADFFYLPLWVAALVLAALASRAKRFGTGWLVLTALALLTAQFSLPEYPKYFEAPYRVQLGLTLLMLAGTLLTCLGGARLARRRYMPLVVAGAFAAANLAALIGFGMVRPHVEALYRDTLSIGAGWWLTLAALAAGLVALARRARAEFA